ncbi:O-phospho-L-seryl-tRNA(Sec):L-selenocysteinyl-tRNA synthase isoform 1 [Galdieria sulphuraria]|uniref:O-phosphoseryl-tRNA(Sec) selenium transferase n=1 Tax=Galdieria sulphuraria TaxID=130081 RepID=M2X8G1_GALSU|nr:O-phospho-L-seryl-tRNA(Sec):L-selenocysteinyl-tRNA synthase isoform 1 [Galdieria sulphuraria]EME32835.1 O-phospho-L-seryl-tRNA(Sec):L-selenocysteinyl-tRNA synthase isoform 1 [Galdieria sulphuraria]|eukprot:XP_005709355.1 O-phospho-L-seryl-tRNA(Sec):L-selenocysteinyl-tRNA synthase isoform 1 [Galdieria sulphuraria]
MNEQHFRLAKTLVNDSYMKQAEESRKRREKLIRKLFANRKLPKDGWDEVTIRLFLQEIASMDSNNFIGNVGAGEREARVFSNIVRERNYSLGHGIGRSGDISAIQPKAAGSSLLAKLTECLVLDAIKIAGLESMKAALVVPVATGMAMTLIFLSLRTLKPHATKIILSRIDQKSCIKSIQAAGYESIIVDNHVIQDEARTDIKSISNWLELEADKILCVVSTMSCFAPRAPDDIVTIATLCQTMDVFHIVNNAYGVQSRQSNVWIESASSKGRVDIVVQSTDKNFMVPVGGAVLVAKRVDYLMKVAQIYPGRASAQIHIDLLITLLQMGQSTWRELLRQREELFPVLKNEFSKIAYKYGERLLDTHHNPISMAMTLDQLEAKGFPVEFFGSMLFTRFVSGTRVVARKNNKTKVCGIDFPDGFGAHCTNYPHSYLTAACALGMTRQDIVAFCDRLDQCFQEAYKKLELPKDDTRTFMD